MPEDKDAVAEDNYAERRREMKRAKEEADLKEKIEKYVCSPRSFSC